MEATTSFPKANAEQKPRNVLRPKDESIRCKKARKAYAATRRKAGSSPLALNADRRAVLEACKTAP